ncbi:MAG: hypothetical protein E4H14_08210 [Candidatus Thorarchaeota archaeon]|nr:MAG: hypothetical protein E4H14_08210 [Candidatus Thorarchaeota archaeon]
MKRGNAICAIVLIGLIGTGIIGLILDTNTPAPVVIDPNATFTGFIDSEGESRLHSIRVYENVTGIHLVLNCPGKDFDLYGKLGEIPTISLYDFRGYQTGGEDVYYDHPDSGIWHLMVRSFSGIGQYDLIIEFDYE